MGVKLPAKLIVAEDKRIIAAGTSGVWLRMTNARQQFNAARVNCVAPQGPPPVAWRTPGKVASSSSVQYAPRGGHQQLDLGPRSGSLSRAITWFFCVVSCDSVCQLTAGWQVFHIIFQKVTVHCMTVCDVRAQCGARRRFSRRFWREPTYPRPLPTWQ